MKTKRHVTQIKHTRKAFSLIMWKMQYFLFIEEAHQTRKEGSHSYFKRHLLIWKP